MSIISDCSLHLDGFVVFHLLDVVLSVLVLLVLADEIVHVGLSLSELDLNHAFGRVPVYPGLSLEHCLDQFSAMFKRKVWLHWYTAEGMDEMEFSEA